MTRAVCVQAGLVLRHGYVPEKRRANRTQNSRLKQCISWGLEDTITSYIVYDYTANLKRCISWGLEDTIASYIVYDYTANLKQCISWGLEDTIASYIVCDYTASVGQVAQSV